MARRVAIPLAIATTPPPLGAVVHDFDGRTMGTTWHARLAGARGLERVPVAQGIQACLDEVVAAMSTWERESDLCRFNRAPAGHCALLPAPFAEVMARALEVAETTGGAFDPAAGALVDAWGFGPRPVHRARSPPRATSPRRASAAAGAG